MEDAYKQFYDLLEKYTKDFEVRHDICVIAHGTDRGVEVILYDGPVEEVKEKKLSLSTGRRNISTMRELAKALNEACDFVEETNRKDFLCVQNVVLRA